jgi:hypothetical protein
MQRRTVYSKLTKDMTGYPRGSACGGIGYFRTAQWNCLNLTKATYPQAETRFPRKPR